MEETLGREKAFWNTLWPGLIVVGVVLFMTIVIFGVETAIPGAHDIFHDFRHSIGISCH